MKRFLCGLLALVSVSSAAMWAAAAQAGPRNSLTLEPVALYHNTGYVEFEHLFDPQAAWAFRGRFTHAGDAQVLGEGWGAGASLRFFPFSRRRAPRGFWLGPAADTVFIHGEYYGVPVTGVMSGAGLEVGYKWLLGRRVAFVISPFVRCQYWFGSLPYEQHPLPTTYRGTILDAGLSLGVAF